MNSRQELVSLVNLKSLMADKLPGLTLNFTSMSPVIGQEPENSTRQKIWLTQHGSPDTEVLKENRKFPLAVGEVAASTCSIVSERHSSTVYLIIIHSWSH